MTAPAALLGSIKCHHCLSLGAGTSMSSFFEPSPPHACLRECEFQSRRGQGGERPGRRHSSGEKGWFTQYECLFFYVSGAHRVSRAQQHVEHSKSLGIPTPFRFRKHARRACKSMPDGAGVLIRKCRRSVLRTIRPASARALSPGIDDCPH